MQNIKITENYYRVEINLQNESITKLMTKSMRSYVTAYYLDHVKIWQMKIIEKYKIKSLA